MFPERNYFTERFTSLHPQTEPPAYNLTDIRVPMALYVTTDDIFAGVETSEEFVARFRPDLYRLIEDDLMTHIDSHWGWDARCSIHDNIVSRFDRSELRRAVLAEGAFEDPNDLKFSSGNSSASGMRRLRYRKQRVPEFLETLPFEKACVGVGIVDRFN